MSCHELDHNRKNRLGFPEIIYGEFKTVSQLDDIIREHLDRNSNILVTRLQADKGQLLVESYRNANYDKLSQTFSRYCSEIDKREGSVGVISGGTSDSGIVKEAVNTLSYLGIKSISYNDIGVAGIHRLLDKKEALMHCDVLIAIAGFEGALPSVVGGIFPQPIIAVPTSVGYGVASGGTTALNAMLTSCANGILVTNIDNGCGAALAAARILNQIYKS